MSNVSTIFVFDVNRAPSSPNPTDEEVQDAKLLYYYPDHREVEERRSHLGLIEGLLVLLASFTKHKIDFLRTKLFTTTISEWCDGIYLVVCFKNEENSWNEMAEYSHHWKHYMTKVVLENAKKLFELLHGPLRDLLNASDGNASSNLESVRRAFEDFLPSFITKAAGDSFNILNAWNASYKSHASALSTLDAQTLIADLCSEFEAVHDYVFIHNKEVLHSSLDLDNMLALYTYLIKHQGSVSERQELRMKPLADGEGVGEAHIMKSESGDAFSPKVHINGQAYHLGVVCMGGLYLVLLLQCDDVMFTLSSIKEYLSGTPNGMGALLKSLSQPPVASKLRTVSINAVTKTIRSVGYNEIDEKALRELQVIRGIHHLIESSLEVITRMHVRSKQGWCSAQVSNGREMYLTLPSESLSLTDVSGAFNEFVKTFLGGIYFI
ncbi:hypothetical protein, conserved [Babesia bigemina]|uniref:CCZ1/INTU/HSP4 first Longin domain-containing protein n=1 Tax=Babesia bigemina TaxID=5866 RepID=A0A061D8D3_BABBI|nr:hypothetical protein, conserved [Babesia bigemina]CDR96778.1 hypothetical protein, conserved [Babesia bigemina]|eukprot:XP_012768964.1 hypothetical protein, conserved [Babesia bigemina]